MINNNCDADGVGAIVIVVLSPIVLIVSGIVFAASKCDINDERSVCTQSLYAIEVSGTIFFLALFLFCLFGIFELIKERYCKQPLPW